MSFFSMSVFMIMTVLLVPLIQLVVVHGQIHDPLPVILIHGYRQGETS